MKPICNFCKESLSLKQKISVEKNWAFNTEYDYFSINENSDKTEVYCAKCSKPIEILELAAVGMYHHSNKRNYGSGTNFYKIYAESAPLYHLFSLAEDRENIILKNILNNTKNGGTLLDVGCGTGKYVGLLSGYFKKIYALDISKELLTFAQKSNEEKTNIEYILSGAEKIPLLDNSVDTIISTWGSFSPNETLFEMKRVLKKGGTIIRVGTTARDDLTKLYSEFDEAYIKENNSYFESHNFKTQYSQIFISFDSVEESKRVLSGITGQPKEAVDQKILIHRIVIQIYKKIADL